MTSDPGVPALGIDLIEIDRVERALQRRPRLAARLFRPGELRACEDRARPARHLAARFAAKEAAIKALGGGFGPLDVEVGREIRRRSCSFTAAPQRSRPTAGSELSVSLTHSRDNAAAVVLASPLAGTA